MRKENKMKKEIEALKKELTSELYPLQAAVFSGDEEAANEAILELALVQGELRLTAYRLSWLLDALTHGTPEA